MRILTSIVFILVFSFSIFSKNIAEYEKATDTDTVQYSASELFKQSKWMNEVTGTVSLMSVKFNYLKGFKLLPWLAINAGLGLETFSLDSPRFGVLILSGIKFPAIVGKNYSCFGANYCFGSPVWSYYGGNGFQNTVINLNYQYGFPINKNTFLVIGIELDYHKYYDLQYPNAGLRIGFIL